MNKFYREPKLIPPIIFSEESLSRNLWGIKFRLPLLNAAGMFKNGENYDFIGSIGAGGYIGGTSTFNSRVGNIKLGIKHPFITLAKSKLSVNFLGLPNLGDGVLSQKRITSNKIDGCPIGWSVMRSPDFNELDGLQNLVKSLFLYQDNLLIEFIEINESCPNVGADFTNLASRLQYVAENFLVKRERNLPVIIKLSNDININMLPQFLDLLFKYGFDGINIGNTSTDYKNIMPFVLSGDKRLFNWFTNHIGGGVGGNYLKDISLKLCTLAVEHKNKINPDYEFHVIRTGGVDSYQDIVKSNEHGISLNQWYTGFFDNYLKFGKLTYSNLFNLNLR